MNGLVQDLRHGLRSMAKTPATTAAVVLTLAVAIGLNSAAFSLVDTLLFRPLPVARPGELVHVYTATEGGLLSHGPLAFPDYEDLRDRVEGLASAAAYALQPMSLQAGDRSELLMGEVVTGGYFATLGLEAARGRLLAPEDDLPGAPPVAVLGHRAWRVRFGGDPAVVGREVRLSGHAFTVVGVAPEGFSGLTRGLAAELFVPVHAAERLPAGVTVGFGEATPGASRLADRSRRWAWVVARLRDGAGLPAARSEFDALGRRLADEHPGTHRRRRFAVESVVDVRLLPGVDRVVRAGSLGLLALAGLVLLVAALNVANVLLARAVERRGEMATRLSLGAGRWRLGRQLLVEGLLLALAGGAAGLVLAANAGRVVATAVPSLPWPVEVALDLPVDLRVLLFSLALSAATAVLFGLAPALESFRTDLVGALRGEGSTPAAGRRRLAGAFVVAQVGVSVVLLVDPALPVLRLQTYEDALADALFAPRAAAGLFGLFGLLAFGLATFGVHAVLAHAAARRTREMGVRLALGASRGDVVALVVGHGARLTTVGLAVGLAVALVAARGLRASLFGVSPADPATFVAVPLVFAAVALLASYLPARRASRLDPAEVLRSDP